MSMIVICTVEQGVGASLQTGSFVYLDANPHSLRCPSFIKLWPRESSMPALNIRIVPPSITGRREFDRRSSILVMSQHFFQVDDHATIL